MLSCGPLPQAFAPPVFSWKLLSEQCLMPVCAGDILLDTLPDL
jgi:hypothetical protein